MAAGAKAKSKSFPSRISSSASATVVLKGTLTEEKRRDRTVYGEGSARFAGSTYDPTSHYRAAAVLDFFASQGLTQERLRERSQHQVALLMKAFDGLDLHPDVIDRDRSVPLEGVAGFLALRTRRAAEFSEALAARDVRTDYRGEVLRFGPAPYVTDDQLRAAMGVLAEVVRSMARPARDA